MKKKLMVKIDMVVLVITAILWPLFQVASDTRYRVKEVATSISNAAYIVSPMRLIDRARAMRQTR